MGMLRLRPALLAAVMGGGAAPWVPPYDAIANLVHVYEPARRVLTSYTGNLVRLRRASDDAEADFGYVAATGELDVAAIAAWAGGAANVVTVYDQKGGDNITQAVALSQPLYVASAQNGHAGMTFDGGDNYMLSGSSPNLDNATIMVVARQAAVKATGGNSLVSTRPTTTYAEMIFGNSVSTGGRLFVQINDGTARAIYNGTPGTSWVLAEAVFDGDAPSISAGINGSLSSVLSSGGPLIPFSIDGTSVLTVGQLGGLVAGWYFNGSMSSVIIINAAFGTAARQELEAALNTYWGIW